MVSRGGFAAVPWCLIDSDASRPALLVYVALARFADEHGRCWPSHAKLAEVARLSRRTVVAALQELAALGLVEWSGRAGDTGAQATNVYTIRMNQGVQPVHTGVQPVHTPYAATAQGPVQPLHTELEPVELEPVKEARGGKRTRPSVESERAKASPDVRALVERMRGALQQVTGDAPRLTAEWYQQMRLLVASADAQAVDAAMQWALADTFWSGVVTSPAKLRKHWDTIRVQMARRPAREQEAPPPNPWAEDEARERRRLLAWLDSVHVSEQEWLERQQRNSPEDQAWRDRLFQAVTA